MFRYAKVHIPREIGPFMQNLVSPDAEFLRLQLAELVRAHEDELNRQMAIKLQLEDYPEDVAAELAMELANDGASVILQENIDAVRLGVYGPPSE
jgi:hypothetical protein